MKLVTQKYVFDLDSCFVKGNQTVRYSSPVNITFQLRIHCTKVQSCLVWAG